MHDIELLANFSALCLPGKQEDVTNKSIRSLEYKPWVNIVAREKSTGRKDTSPANVRNL